MQARPKPEWAPTDLDKRIWEEELDSFVPSRVYDIHTHLHRWSDNLAPAKEDSPYAATIGRHFPIADWNTAEAVDAALMPGRTVSRLSFPFPYAPPVDFDAANAFVAGETAAHAPSGALMLVHPGMAPHEIEAAIRRHGFLGLKPYLVYARGVPPADAYITDFLPEEQIALADRFGLIIMMHISRRDAIADEGNITEILRLSERYPGARWVLAHCARSYAAWGIEAAAARLRGLANVWYDTSTVCDSDAIDALYQGVGEDRVMYGSDDLIGPMHGRYVTFGKAWAFLHAGNQSMTLGHCDPRFTLIRYESLRAMKRGARGFTSAQREALFHDTAAGLVAAARESLAAQL